MSKLMDCTDMEIISLFNDEITTFVDQLMNISTQISLTPEELVKINKSKKDLDTGMRINLKLCIELYTVFLFKPEHDQFVESVKNRNYDYFYKLVAQEDIDDEFKELLEIITTVSYNLDNEIRNDIFGYLENITDLALVYVAKTVKKI
jgi:hypothetical protein